MDAQQISMVQQSWEKVKPLGPKATEIFYGRLFEQYPEVRGMFPADMQNQQQLLFRMINSAVIGINHVDDLVPTLHRMGRRHAGYGVKSEDYGKVAAALLWTLEHALGDDWNDELAQAWTECYSLLASTMQSAPETA